MQKKLKQYQIKDAKSYYNRHQDYDALKQYKAQFDEYLKTDTKLAEYIKAHPEEEALKILTTKAKFNKNKGYKNYKLPNLVAYVEKEVNSAEADKTTDKEPMTVKNDDKTQQVEDNDIA